CWVGSGAVDFASSPALRLLQNCDGSDKSEPGGYGLAANMSSIVACSEVAAGINLRAGSHALTAPVTAKSQMKTSTTIP
ncbi:MAG TPA: hypothetical protein VFR76_07160, partial [Verrucomicrobiae bacterium]|nr:hypothetical protein [Verrucomicrobiae bacterium]